MLVEYIWKGSRMAQIDERTAFLLFSNTPNLTKLNFLETPIHL